MMDKTLHKQWELMDELQESSQKSCNAKKNTGTDLSNSEEKGKSDILMVELQTFSGLSIKNT